MDGNRFDDLAMRLARVLSRRRALATLAAGAAASLSTLAGGRRAGAACQRAGTSCTKGRQCCSRECCGGKCCAMEGVCTDADRCCPFDRACATRAGVVCCPEAQRCTPLRQGVNICCPKSSDAICDRSCTNTQSDSKNCGTCGNKCAANEICRGGKCGCGPLSEHCDGVCTNVQSDPKNCGTCGNKCVTCQMCLAGACTTDCPIGKDCCGTSGCVDTQTNPAHCGGCGITCDPDASCEDGKCVCSSGARASGTCECPNGEMPCNGACVDTQTNPDHCGECDTKCTPCTECRGGACQPVDCGDPCSECRDGACAPKECDACEACQGGECVRDPNCCPETCTPCNECRDGSCQPVDCGDPCLECRDDACFPKECGACESCVDGGCLGYCGSCQTCDNGACRNCAPDETCVNGKCCPKCASGASCPTTPGWLGEDGCPVCKESSGMSCCCGKGFFNAESSVCEGSVYTAQPGWCCGGAGPCNPDGNNCNIGSRFETWKCLPETQSP
jgi:hypothetical protein